MKTIKLLFTVLLLLCATVATAYDFYSEGIYYNISSDKTVEVTRNSLSNEYTGIVRIPSSVTYNGTVYSVTSIGDYAFNCCAGLTSIEIPNSVTSIGKYAFAGCTGLTSIEIPNSVTSFGKYAFSSCSRLTSIEIPNSVTSIGDYAFSSCSRLTSIEIPNSVTSFGYAAFFYCTGLTSIMVDKNNPVYDSRDNCNAIIETASNTLICACQNTIIPNSVTSIGYCAFAGCTGLTSIEIPNSVTSIGDEAFHGCTGLTSIEIGNSVTSIGDAAFAECYVLTSIEIPNSVTSFGDYAFQLCSRLTSIEIPNSVTSIGDYAFQLCSRLTSIEIPNSVTSIGNGAFYGCTELTNIVIGNSITKIGDYAFCDCNNIFEIKIGLKEAISASETIFSEIAYNNACLYVPVGSKDSYAKTSPWSYFDIKEMDFTGIENVFDDIKGENGNTKTIYNLNGYAVENPTNGIYIINGKKVLVK